MEIDAGRFGVEGCDIEIPLGNLGGTHPGTDKGEPVLLVL